MKEGSITIEGIVYAPIKTDYGKCCVNCDLGQVRCNHECYRFEENADDYCALKAVDSVISSTTN